MSLFTDEFTGDFFNRLLPFWDTQSIVVKNIVWNVVDRLKSHLKIIVSPLDIIVEFWDTIVDMALPDQKKRLLKAKIAVALHDELGRVPKEEEINQVFLLSRVMYKAVLGLHFRRQEQKRSGQLAIF